MRFYASVLAVAVLASGCTRELPIVEDEPNTARSPNGSQRDPLTNVTDPAILALAQTTPKFELAKPRDFYRIDLARDGTQVSVQKIARITSGIQPLPVLTPEYFLVSHKGRSITSAIAVGFPTRLQVFGRDASSRIREHAPIAMDPSSTLTTTVYLDATQDIDALELVDPNNQIAAAIDLADLPQKASPPPGVGLAKQSLTLDDVRWHFPHIKFLDPSDSLPSELSKQVVLAQITPDYARALDEALKVFPPALLSSLQNVGIGDFASLKDDEGDLDGIELGPTIVMAVGDFQFDQTDSGSSQFTYTLIHEAAHVLMAASQAAAGAQHNWTEQFTPEIVASAKRTNQTYHLLHGLDQT
jgi:hypothetical protein